MKNVLFCLSFFIFSCLYSAQPELNSGCFSIQEKLKEIPPKDLVILENFFRSLFKQGDFAYTLFGDKPMASVHHFIEFIDWWWEKDLQQFTLADWRGWEVWKRYQHLFPLNNFFFVFTSQDFSYHLGLFLMNKEKCREVVRQHFDFFKSYFKAALTEEEMIEKICLQEFTAKGVKEKHWYIFSGFLFGYEEKNVQLFEKKFDLRYRLTALPFDLNKLNEQEKKNMGFDFFRTCDDTCCSQSGAELIQQLNLYENFRSFVVTKKKDPLFPIRPPCFVALPDDPDLDEMCLRYDAIRKKLIDIYYSPNFLEIILTRLSS